MYKLTNYLSSLWNWLDLMCIFFYIFGNKLLACFAQDIQTIENKTNSRAEWGRIFVVLSLVCFYLRLLNMFAVSRALGSKIKIISQMWRDLRVIVAILIVLMVAFAVSFRALVASQKGPEFSFYELRDIVAKSWWLLFGEFSTDLTKNLLQNCNSVDRSSYNTNSTYCHELSSNYTENLLENCTSNASYAHYRRVLPHDLKRSYCARPTWTLRHVHKFATLQFAHRYV